MIDEESIQILKNAIDNYQISKNSGIGTIIGAGVFLISATTAYMKEFLLTYFSENFLFLAQIANFGISLVIISIIFVLIYHFLPDVKVRWSASWFGAINTSILFILGKIVIGILIGSSNLGAVYGAASSFIGILVWIYYSSLIFYFGVELTRQYSIYFNHENTPLKYQKVNGRKCLS